MASNNFLPVLLLLYRCTYGNVCLLQNGVGFCPKAYDSLLDATYLSGTATTVRQHLQAHREILHKLPACELVGATVDDGWQGFHPG
jgi:hypothetical protein